MFSLFIQFFNHFIIFLFGYIYKYGQIETTEDKYHKEKKNNTKYMNKVKFEFKHKSEFYHVKQNVMNVIQNEKFLQKFDITTETILNQTNHTLWVSFYENSIFIYFNHYYISGSQMFVFLNKIVDSTPPKFLQTNPFLGMIYLPLYFWEYLFLTKKHYLKNENQTE